MKFLCVACDQPMTLQDAMPAEEKGTLAVVYVCGGCDHQIAMLTNPWETQLVQSLGVRIGPKSGGKAAASQEAGAVGEVAGKCPFAGMVQELGAEPPSVAPTPDADPSASVRDSLQWSAEALSRLDRIPEFVRPMAKQGIEHWARDHGCDRVTEEVLEQARGTMGMSSPGM